MLRVFGPTDKNVLKTGEMLKMLKVLWGDPPFFVRGGGLEASKNSIFKISLV